MTVSKIRILGKQSWCPLNHCQTLVHLNQKQTQQISNTDPKSQANSSGKIPKMASTCPNQNCGQWSSLQNILDSFLLLHTIGINTAITHLSQSYKDSQQYLLVKKPLCKEPTTKNFSRTKKAPELYLRKLLYSTLMIPKFLQITLNQLLRILNILLYVFCS